LQIEIIKNRRKKKIYYFLDHKSIETYWHFAYTYSKVVLSFELVYALKWHAIEFNRGKKKP